MSVYWLFRLQYQLLADSNCFKRVKLNIEIASMIKYRLLKGIHVLTLLQQNIHREGLGKYTCYMAKPVKQYSCSLLFKILKEKVELKPKISRNCTKKNRIRRLFFTLSYVLFIYILIITFVVYKHLVTQWFTRPTFI